MHARLAFAAVALACAAHAAPPSAAAQERPIAFQGARVLPVSGPAIENGTLLIRDGRIVAVGPRGSVALPRDAEVVDVTGRTLMPGLVDTHSHIGEGNGGDRSDAMHPSVRILDALDARSEGIQKAQAGGITTANIMPGSGLLMSGQTAYVKLRDGTTIHDLLICEDPVRDVCGGMKMANGTNPRGASPLPGTRAKAAAIVRDRFVKAEDYRRKLREADGDASKRPDRSLELEALVEVLDGRRVVHHHTHRHDDILTVLRLQEEFGFRLVLQHVSDAWMVADRIAAAGVPASTIILDSPGGKLETKDLHARNAAALEQAGALVALHTDDGITDSRFFLRSAALAVREGMSRDGALRAVTLNGARMLGLEDRLGSLEPGKDADFILLSGDPLSVYTRVEQTWIDGAKVFDIGDPTDREFAVGGPNLDGGAAMHHHAGLEDH